MPTLEIKDGRYFSRYVALATLLVACTRDGDLGEQCHTNGSCNHPTLECTDTTSWHGHCSLKRVATSQAQDSTPESAADRFCEHCLTRCGDAGIKACAYTDTSVWGSKPTTCECR